jgi:hypothetical protein
MELGEGEYARAKRTLIKLYFRNLRQLHLYTMFILLALRCFAVVVMLY